MTHVAIAVPTFRRPDQLRTLLASLAAQVDAPSMTIVIADNDRQRREGVATAEAMVAAGYIHAIDAFVVETPGLCHARNALVDHALAVRGATHVAMLDDDQWVGPDWLARLLAAHRAYGADMTGAPVRYQFDGPPPHWNDALFVFQAERRDDGPTGMLFSLTSAIADRALWDSTPAPWFDTRLNQIGGEDLDLYTRWAAAGRRFGWTNTTEVFESVPADRTTLRWAWRRVWRVGNTDTIVAWNRAGAARRGVLLLRTLAMTGAALVLWPLSALSTQRRLTATGRVIRQFGRIAGLTGHGFKEYGG
jgi:succinoglycan biosynthesis protein ExoM